MVLRTPLLFSFLPPSLPRSEVYFISRKEWKVEYGAASSDQQTFSTGTRPAVTLPGGRRALTEDPLEEQEGKGREEELQDVEEEEAGLNPEPEESREGDGGIGATGRSYVLPVLANQEEVVEVLGSLHDVRWLHLAEGVNAFCR